MKVENKMINFYIRDGNFAEAGDKAISIMEISNFTNAFK